MALSKEQRVAFTLRYKGARRRSHYDIPLRFNEEQAIEKARKFFKRDYEKINPAFTADDFRVLSPEMLARRRSMSWRRA